MEIFSFSDKIVDRKNFDLDPTYLYYYLPARFSKDLENSVMVSVVATVDKNYFTIAPDVGYRSNIAVREMIKNARWHGGSKKELPTFLGLFLNQDNFCIGICDGGDYFKNEKVKDIWENKKLLESFGDVGKEGWEAGVGRHFGYKIICGVFDKIKIDSEKGVLYGVVNIEDYKKKFKI